MKVLILTSTDEFAQFSVAFPKSWNEGTVTYQVFGHQALQIQETVYLDYKV